MYLSLKDSEHFEERSHICLYANHLAQMSGTWKYLIELIKLDEQETWKEKMSQPERSKSPKEKQ